MVDFGSSLPCPKNGRYPVTAVSAESAVVSELTLNGG